MELSHWPVINVIQKECLMQVTQGSDSQCTSNSIIYVPKCQSVDHIHTYIHIVIVLR